jgi:hypothetical protein
MARGRHGGTILLLAIVAITAFALLAIADDGEASWSGEPLPSWGGDWYIFQDTVYTDETIRLDGDIYVFDPYTLSLNGCTVIFNSSYDGQHGIGVYWNSVLYINDSASNDGVVKSNSSSEDWYFWADGEVYFQDVDLMDVDYGIYSYSTYLYVEGCTISSTYNGIYSYADAHIGNTTINVHRPDGYGSLYTYGIYAGYGNYLLQNLILNILVDSNETRSTSSFSNSYYTYGIYMYNANVGRVGSSPSGTFEINIVVDVYMESSYSTSSYVYFYHRFYTRPLYLYSGTVCKALVGIDINIDEHATSYAPYASNGAYVRVYNYQYLVYNTISTSGESPGEYGDMTLSLNMAESTVLGQVYAHYEYLSNYIFYISHSDGAQPDDTVVSFHDITVKDSYVYYVFRAPRYGPWSMTDCTFENIVAQYFMYLYYCDSEFTISDCTFSDLDTMGSGNYLFYIYRTEETGTFLNNTFSYVEGYRIFYIYYNYGPVLFKGNLFTDNMPWSNGEYWANIYYAQESVTFDSNTFRNNQMQRYMFYIYYNYENFVFTGNTVEDNRFFDAMFYTYYNRANFMVTNNEFRRNNGRLFYLYVIYTRSSVSDNVFEDNVFGSSNLMYTYALYSDLEITFNEVTSNTADQAIFFFQGPTYFSTSAAFTFDQNVLTDNTVGSDIDDGILLVRGARYSMAMRRNEFHQNTGTCINFFRPYSSNTWYTDYTFTVDNNLFMDNDGAATTWVDFRSYNIVVKRNIGSGNTGPLIYHTLTSRYVSDGFYPGTYGEMSGPVSIEVLNNNYTDNMAGAIQIERAQWRDSSTPYTNPDQAIRISNNILKNNGDGWAIEVNDFGPFPALIGNVFDGSKYGVYLSAIYPGLWPRQLWSFEGASFDGGANGVTAFGLVNVDAEFTECTFTNYDLALYARDCEINVYWSVLPEGSGWTEGRGYIYVWNHLEILITWLDEMGVDSGQPAAGAMLAMLGTNGRYYGELMSNDMGRIGPMVIQPWSSLAGRMDQWSPYIGTLSYGGSASRHEIHIIGEHMGDDALHLTIKDTIAPEIVVTQPAVGSISNLVDMPAEGFLFETGSGIASFMGYLDGGDGVEIDPAEAWTASFMDLAQGDHTIEFVAIDVATNEVSFSVDFTIDAFAPTLDVVTPADNIVTRDPNLVVQGSYEDDVSEVFEISVTINDIPITATTGVINEPYLLTEGVNTILVQATDNAGNVRTVRRIVTLDSYPPTLYVYTPLNDIITSEPVLEVDGLSEADIPILVEQVRASDGGLIASATPVARDDGVFRATLNLEEGEQHIVFTAEDDAGNVRTITRTVTLDTMPPGLTIESPSEGDFIPTPSADLVAQVTDDNPEEVTVFVNGVPIVHTGLVSMKLPLKEGLNSIVLSAYDEVGNMVTKTVNVTRDTVAPVLVLESPTSLLTNVKGFTVRGYVNDDASVVKVTGVPVNVDEDNRFSVVLDLSTEQSPIEVTAEDEAGNTVMKSIVFTYDSSAPVITLTEQPGAETSEISLSLDGTVTDTVSDIEYVTVRGKDYPVQDGKFYALITLDTAGEGWNNFTISATDEAGNTGVFKVNIQYVPPSGGGPEDEGAESQSMWWYVGLLLIIAAFVLMATVYSFAKRGEE